MIVYHLLMFKLVAALSIFAITIVGAWSVLKKRLVAKIQKKFNMGEAFASGIFLGAALFHMLPNSQEQFHNLYPTVIFPFVNLLCAFSFIVLLYIEKITLQMYKQKQIGLIFIPYIFTLVLSIHSLIEGTTVGINTDISAALIIFMAIIVHKGSESFSLAITLNHSILSNKQIFTVFTLFSFVTPLGIALGSVATQSFHSNQSLLTQAFFNAMAAGTFLYMATMHNTQGCITQECATRYTKIQEFLSMGFGTAVMAVIAFWV